jgi:hypothetical protein
MVNRFLLILLSVICLLMVSSGKVIASSVSFEGVSVSPSIKVVTLYKNQTSASFSILVTNSTSGTIDMSLSEEDFTSLNLSGGISFFNSTRADLNNAHSLASNISTNNPKIIIGPDQSQNVAITINNANKLAAGGHYTAIIFKMLSLSNKAGNVVNVNQAVSTLLFVSTQGEGTQTLDLATTSMSSFTTFPRSVDVVLKNTGDTQSIPRGIVQITGTSSELISQGQINVNSSLILPQSEQLFDVNMSPTSIFLRPGIYKLKILYRHDGQSGYSVYEKNFLYISPASMLAVLVIIVFIVFAIVKRNNIKALIRTDYFRKK